MAGLRVRRLRLVLWAVPAVLLSFGLAWACGAHYWLILTDRDQALMAAPDYYVHDLVDDLVRDGLVRIPASVSAYTQEQWRLDDLTKAQYEQTLAMRRAASGDEAYALGEGLPEDVRLYTAGAVDFHKGRFDQARKYFEAVLVFPPEDVRLRVAWTTYMLGLMYSAMETRVPASDQNQLPDEAKSKALKGNSLHYFQLTRKLVAEKGASDTEDLALASLGQEARLYIWPCRWVEEGKIPDNACAATLSADDFKQALHLYLTQLAAQKAKRAGDVDDHMDDDYDDNGLQLEAYNSLQHVANFVLQNDELLAALLQDEASRRFLLSYIFYQQNRVWGFYSTAEKYGGQYLNALDQVLAQHPQHPNIDLGREGAMLAVLTYRHGRYEQAGRFAQHAKGPAAAWVRAKLALQRGDEAAAAKEYAQALELFEQNKTYTSGIAAADESMLRAETSILALSRSDYLEAMRLLLAPRFGEKQQIPSGNGESKGLTNDRYTQQWLRAEGRGDRYSYDFDIAYIAERLLTLDELKQFVDQNAPEVESRTQVDCKDASCWDEAQALELRWLLARRLVREGRYEESAPYFPKTNDPRLYISWEDAYKDVDLAAVAKTYGDALKASKDFWQTDISRAEHLFNAAQIARYNGMEIMGYALDPDYAITGGNISGLYRDDGDRWVREGERNRYKETAPEIDKRFHYRYVAIDLAEQAADKVPARSQAFAAMMCQAAFWDTVGEKEFRGRLYQRYIKEGAAVPWSFNAAECPEPDFDKARREIWKFRLWLPMEEYARVHPLRFKYALIAGGLLIVGLGLGLWRWRKGRKGQNSVANNSE